MASPCYGIGSGCGFGVFASALTSQEIAGMETGLVWSLGGKSPAAGREMHAEPGSLSFPGAEIKADPWSSALSLT